MQSATQALELPAVEVAVRNLLEQAQYAHLCTIMSRMHHRRSGYPFGSLVDFAVDELGRPIFYLSPLAIHTRNIMEEPRCSLEVQMVGWSGLANARVTFFGNLTEVPEEEKIHASDLLRLKGAMNGSVHNKGWGNYVFFRVDRICDIYFAGGFGTVQWVKVDDYLNTEPDAIVAGGKANTLLQDLNMRFAAQLPAGISFQCSSVGRVDDATIVSIDRLGVDVRLRCGHKFSVERLPFRRPVETQVQAEKELTILLNEVTAVHPKSDDDAICSS